MSIIPGFYGVRCEACRPADLAGIGASFSIAATGKAGIFNTNLTLRKT